MSELGLTVEIENHQDFYFPGDNLAFSYRLTDDAPSKIRGLEVTVLWRTQGKGDQDTGVHFFEKLAPEQGLEDLAVRRFSTRLPATPLSYDGVILQIGWCVRVQAFMRGGADLVSEAPFRLASRP